jgi:hypothetical protein
MYNAGNGAAFTTNVAANPAVRHKDLTWTDVGLPWHVGAGRPEAIPEPGGIEP